MLSIFSHIFFMSLAGSIIILLILLCKKLAGNRLPPPFHALIWLAALFVLLVPLQIKLPAIAPKPPAPTVPSAAQPNKGLFPSAWALEQGSENTPSPTAPKQATLSLPLWQLWLSGMFLFGLRRFSASLRLKRSLSRHALPPLASDLAAAERLCRELKLNRPVSVQRNSLTPSPLVYGLFRHRIFLPESLEEGEETELSLFHELIHCRDGHFFFKALALAAAGLHWFNPLCRLMCRDIDFSCELCCDQQVVRRLAPEKKFRYGELLLRTSARFLQGAQPGFSLSKKETLKRRLTYIVKQQNSKLFLTICLSVTLTGASLVCSSAASTITPKDKPVSGITAPTVSSSEKAAALSLEAAYSLKLEQLENELAGQQALSEIKSSNYFGGEMIWPVPGFPQLDRAYGRTENQDGFHSEITICGTADNPILGAGIVAANNGVVEKVALSPQQTRPDLGNYLILNHGGGVSTLYGHCQSISVSEGQTVTKGQVIAAAGSTGSCTQPVVSFGVRHNGKAIDPLPFLETSIASNTYSEPLNLIWPVDGGTISDGMGAYPNHTGTDISAPEGTDIYAAADGSVAWAGYSRGYGNYIVLSHGTAKTRYAHCDTLLVEKGQKVTQGERIATVGATGNTTGAACHFEVIQNGDFLDPTIYIGNTYPGAHLS